MHKNRMKTIVCYSKDDIRMENIPIPDIGNDEMLIKTIYCGLCGSDIAKIVNPSVKKPVKLGHEVIGIVKKTGRDVTNFKKNDIISVSHHIPCFNCVYCRHLNYSMCRHFQKTNLDPQGFAEYIRISAEHIKYNAFLIENRKFLKNAIFMEPLACCQRAVERLGIQDDDSLMILGCGTIGIIFISLLKFLYDVNVIAADISDEKLNTAKNFGADLTVNTKNENLKESISDFSKTGMDFIILTYVTQETISSSMDVIRDGGCIQIFAGPSGKDEIEVNFENLYKREITLFSSYSASPGSCKKSFELLKNGNINLSGLISKTLPVEDFKNGLQFALSQKYFKIIFYFDEREVTL